jgi:hypothetical protein
MCCPVMTTQLKELWGTAIADGWGGLLCGESFDSVIEGNRKGHAAPVQRRARGSKISYGQVDKWQTQRKADTLKSWAEFSGERRLYMSYFSSYCPQVQSYLRACEHLLTAAHNNQQFSEEELQMVESYAMDVAKIHAAFVKDKNHLVSCIN